MNAGIVVCARMSSSRIPNKVMSKIGERRAIDILLSNCQRAKLPIVLAIPDDLEGEPLVPVAKQNKVGLYRGHNGSPLHRLSAAAVEAGFDHVVRITADDILIDPWILKRMVDYQLRKNADYTFCGSIPGGCVGEVINVEKLAAVAARTNHDVEFTSYYLKGDDMVQQEYMPPSEFRHRFRLTLDYPEDLTVLRIIFNSLVTPFGTLDIINFLKHNRNSYVLKINRQPTLTVYTCNYNQGKFLLKAVDSVLDQLDDPSLNLEYIVIDDCSTDGSVEKLIAHLSQLPEQKRQRVTVLRNATNRGLPASCNVALKRARGKYVLRLDADDMLLPGSLDKMISLMIASHDAAALFSGYYEANEAGVIQGGAITNEKRHPGCCMIVTRVAHELKYKEGLEHYEGVEFYRRLQEGRQIAVVDDAMWVYRQHSASKSHSKDPLRQQTADDLGVQQQAHPPPAE